LALSEGPEAQDISSTFRIEPGHIRRGGLACQAKDGDELRRIEVHACLRLAALCGALAGALALSACGGSKLTGDSTGFASERLPDTLPQGEPAPRTQTAEASNTVDPASGNALNCPQVVAWPNERLRTIYQSGHDNDAMYVVNRGEITKLSRECRFYNGGVVVKYGFAGRVLLGPKGQPGAVTLPVAIHATDAYKNTLAKDKMSVRVTVPAGKPVGYFSMVREISFPIRVGTRPEDYKIFVALK
jgi:hypothetical protein